MTAKWVEALTGSLEQKKQYKQAMARIKALPDPYADAATALNRYFMYAGGLVDGDTIVTMMGDHADLWERAALDGTPVRAVVGEDPVEFAEAFVRAYSGKEWIDKERARLRSAIDAMPDSAASDNAAPSSGTGVD
jgi:DNA-binding ferritin-like protein (Dps family)